MKNIKERMKERTENCIISDTINNFEASNHSFCMQNSRKATKINTSLVKMQLTHTHIQSKWWGRFYNLLSKLPISFVKRKRNGIRKTNEREREREKGNKLKKKYKDRYSEGRRVKSRRNIFALVSTVAVSLQH